MRLLVISGLASGIVGLMFTGAALWAFASDEVEVAIDGQGAERQAAIARLRQEGPDGRNRLLAQVPVLDRERDGIGELATHPPAALGRHAPGGKCGGLSDVPAPVASGPRTRNGTVGRP